MSNDPSGFSGKYRKAVTWLREHNIFKGFRIGYHVIWNIILVFIFIGVISFFFAGGVAAGYFASLVKDQKVLSKSDLEADLNAYSQTSNIYSQGKFVAHMKTDLVRENVPLDKVSKHVINALIATEDEYFWTHKGVVPRAVMRAGFQELTHQPQVTGGSTITQQLVKNQILTNEVSFERKAKEILLSMRVERFFTKKQILQDYLNVVPYGRDAAGQNIAGIKAASEGIFNVEPDELSVPQAAYIVGIPKNPFKYTPYENAGGLKDDLSAGITRAHVVLKRMLDTGYITQAEYDKAVKYDYKKHFKKKEKVAHQKHPYFMTEVRKRAVRLIAIHNADEEGYDGKLLEEDNHLLNKFEYLNRINGTSLRSLADEHDKDLDKMKKNSKLFLEFYKNANKQIDQKGYNIYTTINMDIQEKLLEAADSYKGYGKDYAPENGGPIETGAVLLDNDTGAIIGFVGGRMSKYDETTFNYATQAYRQNGSTMKPLLDYGPAIDHGLLSPGTLLPDMPISIPIPGQDPYTPENYGNDGYHGFVTARKALYKSWNVPAVEVLDRNKKAFDPVSYLDKMDFSWLVKPDRGVLPLAIGGMTRGVTVEENTRAYATFANGGKYVGSYMIGKITDEDGKVIYKHKVKPKQVYSPQTAYLITDMLRDVMTKGTAASVPGMLKFHTDWAAKTGTSQDYKDAWLMGYNPNVTLGLWVGYSKSKTLNHHVYSKYRTELFARLANAAYDVDPELMDPKTTFKRPSGITTATFCGLTNTSVSSACKDAGMVSTDLVSTDHMPSGSFDALGGGRYVLVNRGDETVKYQALDSTPSEFTKSGFLLTGDFIQQFMPYVEIEKVPADLWGGLIPVRKMDPVSGSPSAPGGVTTDGSTLKWSSSGSNDVIGYRIYAAPRGSSSYHQIGTTMAGDTSFSVGSYSGYNFVVRAVDISGNTSGNSGSASYGSAPKPEPEKPKPDQPDKPKQDKPDKKDENSGDNQDGGSDKNGDQSKTDNTTDGQTTDDQTTSDDTTNDQTTNDETTNDETTNDETTNDETSNDETTNDETTNDETTNDQTTNDQTTNDQTTNDKTTNDETKK